MCALVRIYNAHWSEFVPAQPLLPTAETVDLESTEKIIRNNQKPLICRSKFSFMPLTYSTAHQPPFWLPNGHSQTVFPSVFRKITFAQIRERIQTSDADFLDLDWSLSAHSPHTGNPLSHSVAHSLIILSHGLEGNSTRQYILGMVRLLVAHGHDCLAWNYRSCSGEINQQLRFYHSGETTDLDLVIQHAIAKGYAHISLVGFSLGGNVTLKYLGERGANLLPEIKKAVVFSVPMDLLACSRAIEKPENWLYLQRFLRSLKPKVEAKEKLYPDQISVKNYAKVKTFYDFDDLYTGPVHGFSGADDYYARSSSMHFVDKITVPTLIVNAQNDPLVPPKSLPLELIAELKNVFLELTTNGGHCGFCPHQVVEGAYWSEWRALAFLED